MAGSNLLVWARNVKNAQNHSCLETQDLPDVLTTQKPKTRQQRAKGTLDLRCRKTDRGTELSDLRHSGSLKALFPRIAGTDLQAVFLNTAGGITGGDEFSVRAGVETHGCVTMTSQAAERAYRAQTDETGRFSVDLTAGPGARLNWLPQETILYDDCALHREMNVNLAPDATFLAVEPVVFGRTAMGEDLTRANFRENWRVRRGDALVFADTFHLHGDARAQLTHPAIANGARAMASVLFVAPNAEAFLDRLRPMMSATSGVSLIRPGVLFARFLAADSFVLRQNVIPVLELFNQSPLPRTWMF